jgi:iron complex outermembrane recepter protein
MNLRERVTTTNALSRTVFARTFVLTAAVAAFLAIDISAASAQIETVVVTARKRAENVQNVPVAVTALTGEKLDQYNITTINQVAAQTPQLIIQRGSSGSGADISLRGIGSSSENIGIEQSVAVNVDGVYLGQGRAINEGFFDMKQVEILKGPQALYFGKNATAGVISLETNDPTDEFEAMVRAGYEFTSDAPYIEGVVSGPVTDDLGLRLAVRGSDMFGGYIENQAPGGLVYNTFDIATGNLTPHTTDAPEKDLPGSKNGLARLTAKWAPLSDLTITGKLAFDAYDNRDSGYNIEPIICPLGHTQANPTETCSKNWKIQQNDFPQGFAASDPIIDKAHGRMFEQFQSYTGMINAEYVTPEYTLSSVSGYQHLFNDWGSDQDFTGMPSVMAGEHFKWHAFSTENRILTTLDFPVNFSGGFYYQSTRLDFNQDVIFANLEDSTVVDPTTRYVAYRKLSATAGSTFSAFGQLIWDIVPGLELTGGARYTHEIKQSFFRQPYVNGAVQGLFVQYNPANPLTQIVAHQDFDNLSPEAVLTWKPEDNLTIYGGYKQGFKSGGFSNSAILSAATNPADLQFHPEKVKGVDGGVKSTWFDNQLQVDIDIYDYLYSNLQVDFFNTPTFNYITLNATSARTEGAEVQAQFAPEDFKGLLLSGTLAYNEAHYGTFNAPCYPAGQAYEQGCTVARTVLANGTSVYSPCSVGNAAGDCLFQNVSGSATALAPKWTASLEADYTTPVSENLQLGLTGNVRFSSGYLTNPFGSSIGEQSDYAMLDAIVRLGAVDNKWQVAVIGKNLTDQYVLTYSAGLPLSGANTGNSLSNPVAPPLLADIGGTALDPRSVEIQITYRF